MGVGASGGWSPARLSRQTVCKDKMSPFSENMSKFLTATPTVEQAKKTIVCELCLFSSLFWLLWAKLGLKQVQFLSCDLC